MVSLALTLRSACRKSAVCVLDVQPPFGPRRAEAEQSRQAFEQELADCSARSEEAQKALQGKLSELSEQLLTSMIEPVKREG